MPIPQYISPHHGQVAERAHKIRLSLTVDPNRASTANNNGSIYQLTEISLLYENAAMPTSQLTSSLEHNYKIVHQSYHDSYDKKHSKESVPHENMTKSKFKGYNMQQLSVIDVPGKEYSRSNGRLDDKYFQTNQLESRSELLQQDLTCKRSSLPQFKDLAKLTIKELLKYYKTLTLEKIRCRSSLDKGVDKFTRNNLENRYFAITEALVSCEQRLKNAGYGEYVLKYKQKIIENVPVAAMRSNLQTPADISSPMPGMVDLDIPPKRKRLEEIQDVKLLGPRNRYIGTFKSPIDRDRAVSEAIDLRKSYQKVNKIRLRLRKNLENDISNMKLRQRIENDYFKAQMKLEKILNKLKNLAYENGMDWKHLYAIINIETDNDDINGSLINTIHSKSSSIHENQGGLDQNSNIACTPHMKKRHPSDDYNYQESEYLESPAAERFQGIYSSKTPSYDSDQQKRSSKSNSKLYDITDDSYHKKAPGFQSKGVQTDGIDLNNNSSVYDTNRKEEQFIDDRKAAQASLEEKYNFIDLPDVHSKVCIYDVYAILDNQAV